MGRLEGSLDGSETFVAPVGFNDCLDLGREVGSESGFPDGCFVERFVVDLDEGFAVGRFVDFDVGSVVSDHSLVIP